MFVCCAVFVEEGNYVILLRMELAYFSIEDLSLFVYISSKCRARVKSSFHVVLKQMKAPEFGQFNDITLN